jgi:hypothetical protein
MSGSHLCIPRNETVISKTEFQDRSAYSAAGKYVEGSWEYINRSQTHEEIGTEAAQFPEKEYMNGIFLAVCVPISRIDTRVVCEDQKKLIKEKRCLPFIYGYTRLFPYILHNELHKCTISVLPGPSKVLHHFRLKFDEMFNFVGRGILL